MSLEKKDVRTSVRPELHAALTAIADAENKSIGEMAEVILSIWIERRVHEVTVMHAAFERAGIVRNSTGPARK